MGYKRYLKLYIFLSITLFIHVNIVIARTKFTNLKCKSHNTTYLEFYKCKVSVINRKLSSFSLTAHLLQLPITNVMVRFRFMRKSNGYKPFLYDFTVDGCKFLKKTTSDHKHPIVNYIYTLMFKYSNINHTCPFNGDIILNNFIADESRELALIFVNGEYGIYSTWSIDNIVRGDVNCYFTVS